MPAAAQVSRAIPCYANCDGSTSEPILNVDDFTCFVSEFAKGISLPQEEQVTHYANCDGSTDAPILNVDDFICFMRHFAFGCSFESEGGSSTQGGDCPSEPCDPQPAPPAQPTPYQIPLKVWRVFAPYDCPGGIWACIPGDPANKGCRLTDEDITAFITDLQSKAYIFWDAPWPPLEFTWDGNIASVIDAWHPGINAPDPRTVALEHWGDPARPIWVSETWDASKINIYFVGNIQPDVSMDFVIGGSTLPPQPGVNFIELPPQIFGISEQPRATAEASDAYLCTA
jgi:hypothetical protein